MVLNCISVLSICSPWICRTICNTTESSIPHSHLTSTVVCFDCLSSVLFWIFHRYILLKYLHHRTYSRYHNCAFTYFYCSLKQDTSVLALLIPSSLMMLSVFAFDVDFLSSGLHWPVGHIFRCLCSDFYLFRVIYLCKMAPSSSVSH